VEEQGFALASTVIRYFVADSIWFNTQAKVKGGIEEELIFKYFDLYPDRNPETPTAALSGNALERIEESTEEEEKCSYRC